MTAKTIFVAILTLFVVNNALPMNHRETVAVNSRFLLNMQADIHEKMSAIKQNSIYLEEYIRKACSLTCYAYEKYLDEHNKRFPGHKIFRTREKARSYLKEAEKNLKVELKQIEQVRRDLRKKTAGNGMKILDKVDFLLNLKKYIGQYEKRINDVKILKRFLHYQDYRAVSIQSNSHRHEKIVSQWEKIDIDRWCDIQIEILELLVDLQFTDCAYKYLMQVTKSVRIAKNQLYRDITKLSYHRDSLILGRIFTSYLGVTLRLDGFKEAI
jgi:hypothetical protein